MSAPPPPAAPKHAARPLFTIYLVAGLVLILLGLAQMSLGVVGAGIGFMSFGTLFAWMGFRGRKAGRGVVLINTSLNLVGQGRFAEAEPLLAEAEKIVEKGPNRRALETQRALIAMRRGRIDEALARIDAAVAVAPANFMARQIDQLQLANARGIRAFVRAAKGDREGAREDIEAVRTNPNPPPQALGRAAVAEAMVLERAGEHAALREMLVRERAVLRNGTDPRERAIIRAFQRMLQRKATSVYRTGASREPERSVGEEPAVVDWVGLMAPSVAAFASAPRALPSKEGAPAVVVEGKASKEAQGAVLAARKKAEAATKKVRTGAGLKVMGLLAGTIGVAFGVLSAMQGSPVDDEELYSGSSFTEFVSRIGVAAVIGAFGALVLMNLRARRDGRALQASVVDRARGREGALEKLEELSKSPFELIASQAHLHLARAAEEQANLTAALDQAERGIARLTRYGSKLVASDILLPELIAERAFVLTAMGREPEAFAELDTLNPAYPFLSRARFRVRLLAFVRKGDFLSAARLADASARDLPLHAWDEFLVDAVRVAASAETCGAGEIGRIKDELRRDAELRRWLDAVAPGVAAAVEKAVEIDDDEAEARRDEAALREAEAIEESETEAQMAQLARV